MEAQFYIAQPGPVPSGSTWFHISWNTIWAVTTRVIGYGSVVPHKNNIHSPSYILCRWSVVDQGTLKFAEPWNQRQAMLPQHAQRQALLRFRLTVPHRGRSVEPTEPHSGGMFMQTIARIRSR